MSASGSASIPARASTSRASTDLPDAPLEQRRAAVIALYQHDLTGRPLAQTLDREARELTRSLAHAAADRAEELDAVIECHAHGWTVGADRAARAQHHARSR